MTSHQGGSPIALDQEIGGLSQRDAWSTVPEAAEAPAGSGRLPRRTASQMAGRVAFLMVVAIFAGGIGVVSVVISSHAMAARAACGSGSCADSPSYRSLAIASGALLAVLLLWSRPDRIRGGPGYVEEILRAARDATIASLGVVLIAFFWTSGAAPQLFSYSRAALVLDWVIVVLLLSLLRIGIRHTLIALRRRGHDVLLIAVVGSSSSARSFVESVTAHPEAGYRIAAHLDGNEPGQDLVATLTRIASTCKLEEVILDTPSLGRHDIACLRATRELHETNIRAVPELFGLPPAKVQISSVLGDLPLLSLFTDPLGSTHRSIKRAMDVLVGTFALVIVSPVILLAAISVRLTSRGPIFLRQERIGMDGRRFEMFKIRSMHDRCDSTPHREYVKSLLSGKIHASRRDRSLYKLPEDPRITPVGRVLRRFSIDELPQLFNVLRGEMSLVGPRPALPFEVELYEEWQRIRLRVRPGITGLWQVSGRSRLTISDMLRLDVHYAEACSLALDLRIILKTLPVVLRCEAR